MTSFGPGSTGNRGEVTTHDDTSLGSWDDQADRFDDEPDHGLRDPEVRAAWADLLARHLPAPPADVADLGCGTGSLAVLLAGQGYAVHGVDASARMLDAARAKAATSGVALGLSHADAAAPPLGDGSVDVVLCRHVLWALPEPEEVLARWVRLLRPGGRLVLVEGRWATGAGLSARECLELGASLGRETRLVPLRDPALWGRPIDDERYLVQVGPGLRGS